MNVKICDGCGETNCDGSCVLPVDEEPMSNCCTAPFTYPGFPDSDICSECHEHADTTISDEILGDKDGES